MIDLLDCKHHIFDLDDTLVNTRYSYKNAQSKAIQSFFADLTEEKKVTYTNELYWFSQTMGSGNAEQYFSAFLKNRNIIDNQPATILKQLLEIYDRNFWGQLSALHNAIDFLQKLQSFQKVLTLVSNGKTRSQSKKMDLTNLSPFFKIQNRFISETFEKNQQKPSPFMLILACEQLKIHPDNSVFYGNSISDILAGNLAGMQTVFIKGCDPVDFSKLPLIAHPSQSIEHWADLL